MALEEYKRKRRFAATPEPRGAATRRPPKALTFVVQLHHARARHYDFRLEVDGVLRSWAVPKGPSLRAGEKRLAVQVEDHPLDYAGFSGTIPEGNYGAGHVAVFDRGTWQPDGDPADAIARGKLEFSLDGQRLKGRWTLVRTGKPAAKPQWLLLKRSDEFAADLDADDLLGDLPVPPASSPGASTAKGRAIAARTAAGGTGQARTNGHTAPSPAAGESVADAPNPSRRTAAPPAGRRNPRRDKRSPADWRARAAALDGAVPGKATDFVAPMLTVAAKGAPSGEHWLHEWKWDGYRLIARSGAQPHLWSRNGIAWDGRVPELERALAELGVDATLDGELIAVDAQGRSDFNGLQHALKSSDTAQLRYAVFDLLRLEGIDLTGAPLVERKALLERLVDGADPRLFYSGHLIDHGEAMFEAARDKGMEGIISKRVDSRYASGRSDQWLKIKAVETRDYVAVGYTAPKGSRPGIGALLLAERSGARLKYVGRVGSGLDDRLLRELPGLLKPLHRDQPTVALPAHTPLPPGRVQWLEPALVVEVIFRGWGKEGLLRQASFSRLRTDKPAEAAVAQPAPLPALTSPDRVVFPDAGLTKQDVYDYYLDVADRLLTEIGGRLLSIVRCPGGIAGPHFFQKHAGPGFGEAVRRHTIRENDGDEATYFYVDNVAGVMNLVQMNAIEMHPWGSRVETLEQPDRMVFDLDPDESICWSDIKAAAREVRDRLQQLGLPSYPRLSGGKGVHVVVPLRPQADWAQVRRFCEAFADAMAEGQPERYVATMSKAKRKGRIFIDWLRNGRGATSVGGWSLRARKGAPVAMPITWEELARTRRPDRFNLRNAADSALPELVARLVANAPVLPTL